LACWIADGVRDRKQELDNFLGQHVIDICLLIRSGQVKSSGWQIVRHRNDRLIERG
jgi:hypothetical protein